MSNSPHAAAAATARQRLAGVLGSLQTDAQIPPSVLEVLSGLARAIGPLFQLERGSADLQLFVQARTVLQETLEKMQTVDQSYPGISDATGAIAQSLGTIFTAMREAGMLPAQTGQSQVPASPAAPHAQPGPAVTPSFAPTVSGAPVPAAILQAQQQPVFQQSQPYVPPAPVAMPQAQPQPYPQPAPIAAAPVQMQQPAKPVMQMQPAGGPQRAPSTHAMKVPAAAAAVPVGPNGVPRFESEIGVHTETNFFTDFLGDIRNHGGIFVATFHDLAVNAPCEVFLTFPGNLTAELRGTVRWKREASPSGSLSASPGLGVEITYADAKAWDLIDRFIRKREPIMHES